MKKIGDLFTRRIGTDDDGLALYASLVVATANTELEKYWIPTDARAVSFRRGELHVDVSHGAIAGEIHQRQQELVANINQHVKQRLPAAAQPIHRVTTRQR